MKTFEPRWPPRAVRSLALACSATLSASACATSPAPQTDLSLAMCRAELETLKAASEKPQPAPLRGPAPGETAVEYAAYVIERWAEAVEGKETR